MSPFAAIISACAVTNGMVSSPEIYRHCVAGAKAALVVAFDDTLCQAPASELETNWNFWWALNGKRHSAEPVDSDLKYRLARFLVQDGTRFRLREGAVATLPLCPAVAARQRQVRHVMRSEESEQ